MFEFHPPRVESKMGESKMTLHHVRVENFKFPIKTFEEVQINWHKAYEYGMGLTIPSFN